MHCGMSTERERGSRRHQARLRWRAMKSRVCASRCFEKILDWKRCLAMLIVQLEVDPEETQAQRETSHVFSPMNQQSMSCGSPGAASEAFQHFQRQGYEDCVSSMRFEEGGCSEAADMEGLITHQMYAENGVQGGDDMVDISAIDTFCWLGDSPKRVPSALYQDPTVRSLARAMRDAGQPEFPATNFLPHEPRISPVFGIESVTGAFSTSFQPPCSPTSEFSGMSEMSIQGSTPQTCYEFQSSYEIATAESVPPDPEPEMHAVVQSVSMQKALQISPSWTGPIRLSVFFRLVCASKRLCASIKRRLSMANRHPRVDGPAGYKGIRQRRNGKWVSEIRVTTQAGPGEGGKYWLGSYDTPTEAARAFDAGKFYCSNSSKRTRSFNFHDSPRLLSPREEVERLPQEQKRRKILERVKAYAKFGSAPPK